MEVTHKHESFITFYGIELENLAATENTTPWFIGILKGFIVNMIKVCNESKPNSYSTKQVTFNSFIISLICFHNFAARKVY